MRKWLLFLYCLSLPLAARAAFDPTGIHMTASVNKTVLTTEEELTLTVTVDGAAGDFAPQLPSLPSFNVYGRAVAKQIQNFHAVSTFEYLLLPRFAGKATIGPITLEYGNKTYQTQPITVTVYRPGSAQAAATPPAQGNIDTAVPSSTQRAAQTPSAPPAASAAAPAGMPPLERTLYNQAAKLGAQDYFMTAAVSDASPYANQTFTLAVRFYYDKAFAGSAPYTAPSITNLFLEEIGRSDGHQTISGKNYQYIEIRYAAVGVTPGPAEVGPASIQYTPAGRWDSLLDRMFSITVSSAQPAQTVRSQALPLTIRAVPQQDQPASFYGAVGSGYRLSASLDRTEVEAGDAVNLTVNVNGPGNLKPTQDLQLPPMSGLKAYDVVATSGSKTVNGALQSYKIFKTVLVPVSSGEYEIPALAWSYYDPQAKAYKTLRTHPLSLRVTPSTKTENGFDFSSHTDLGSGFKQLGTDIRYVKSSLPQAGPNGLERAAGLPGLNWLALGLLVAAALLARTDKRTLAGKRALARARARLPRAQTPQEVAETLSLYLQVQYGVHMASLPLRELESTLQTHGCSAPLAAQFSALWQSLEAARFAPGAAADTQELARRARRLLKEMDHGGRA